MMSLQAAAAGFTSPACWSWPAPTEADRERVLAKYPTMRNYLLGKGEELLRSFIMIDWQDCRCAMCGSQRERLIEDHCHQSGLVRGYLCGGCNISEGRDTGSPLWQQYRERNPASICGVRERYWDDRRKEFAQPAPEFDPWADNPMRGAGL